MIDRLRSTPWWALVFAAVFCATAGCKTIYSDANRPGHIDVTEPPEEMDDPERLQPEDPGGWGAVGSLRFYSEIAGASYRGVRQSSYPLGAEMSFGAARIERLRHTQGFLSPAGIHVVGAVVGANLTRYNHHEVWRPRVYMEADTRLLGLIRGSAGWTVRPTTGHHGPQVTVGIAHVLHTRANWDIGHGWSMSIGVSIPLYAVFVRSR